MSSRTVTFKVCLLWLPFLLLSFLTPLANTKTPPIVGRVLDATTNRPLAGATVTIEGTKYGASTDTNGYFSIACPDFPPGEIKLRVHLIGYEEKLIFVAAAGETLVRLRQTHLPLGTIVVTGTRHPHLLADTPVPTEIITAEQLRQTQSLSLDKGLQSHIGVDVTDDFSGRGVSIRGVDASRILVLADGNRVIGRVLGSLDLAQLPTSSLKQIEIVKGSGSVLYGSEAMGGVINLVTDEPSSTTRLDLDSRYGSFGSYAFRGRYDYPLIGEGITLDAQYEHTDGFDLDKSTEHTNGQERLSRLNLGTRTLFAWGGGWTIKSGLTFTGERKDWVESEIFPGSTGDTTYNFDDREKNLRTSFFTRSRWQNGDRTELMTNLHFSRYDHLWEKFTRTGYRSDDSRSIEDIVEISFVCHQRLSKGLLTTGGMDFASESLMSEQLANDKARVSRGDAYLQFEWRPVRSFVILPGVRLERHQTYGTHINPSISVMLKAASYLTMRASVGKGFRAPSLKELYFRFDHSAAGYLVNGGGSDLRPEISTNYQLAVESNFGYRILARASYFRNELSDLIDFSAGDFSDPRYWRGIYRYVNVLKARTSGVEAESQITFCRFWKGAFSYMYLSARNLTDHTPLLNRPKHNVRFNQMITLHHDQTTLNCWGFWHSRKLWEAAASTPTRLSNEYAPSRVKIDIALTHRLFRQLALIFMVENLTDDKNAVYGYWPARTITIGLTYTTQRSK